MSHRIVLLFNISAQKKSSIIRGFEFLDLLTFLLCVLLVLADEALVLPDLVILVLQLADHVVLDDGQRGRRAVSQGLYHQQWGQ